MTDPSTLLDEAARHAREFLAAIQERHVGALASGDELRALLGGPLEPEGADPSAVIEALARAAERGTVGTQGPRYFGFVVGGSLPAATAADWLVSAWDQNAGLFVLSPIVSVIEEVTAGWLRHIVGLSEGASVGFVTGCQMANFTALAAARHHVLRSAGWNVESDGMRAAPPIDVFVSDEAHYTIFMGLRLLGFGASCARRIPCDGQGRMLAGALEDALAERSGPAIVCAQAGNVNTGAFDPIAAIAASCRRRGAWLHVDGAFGLWAAASPALRLLVAGIERADSIATDAHKWLNAPYDSGIVFCAYAEAHRAAMSLGAAYIVADAVERDPHEFVPEESRRARAVPVYAALRSLGTEGLSAMVERGCTLARRMADRLSKHADVHILNDVVLNQVLVRFEPDGRDADIVTRAVIAGVQREGTCWLGGTTWHGIAAMRVSVSSWRTTEVDVDHSADAILSVFEQTRD